MIVVGSGIDFLSKLANPFKGIVLDDTCSHANRVYLFTVCILAGFLVTLNQFAGDKIVCHGFNKFEDDFVNNYCWCQGIYTIKEAYDMHFDELPYPGIYPKDLPACIESVYWDGEKYSTMECPDESEVKPLTLIFHLWYQWVPFYFWICAAFFYFPYVVFKQSDIGSLKKLVQLLTENMEEDADAEKKRVDKASRWLTNKLLEYITADGVLQIVLVRHKLFWVALFTRVANLLTVLIVLVLTNKVFGIGSFLTYGTDWIKYIRSNETFTNTNDNPMDKLFPKMAACEVKQWGTSGIDNENGMCVLAPNVINSHTFLIFWFVLMLALAANIFSLLFITTAQLFTAARWKRLVSSAFVTSTKQGKEVFWRSGTSGRMTLEIIARNVPARTFEQLFNRTCSNLLECQAKTILSLARETSSKC